MDREGIIIIICFGILILFYLFQVDSDPIKEVNLVKEQTIQSADDIIKNVLQHAPQNVYTTTSDSLDNKGNQPK